ncbi:hypothetical protein ACHAWF_003086 [Thalassiosira exigua]
MIIPRKSVNFLALSAIAAGVGPTAAAAAQLRFTAIPGQQESTMLARADAVTAYLESYISSACDVDVNAGLRSTPAVYLAQRVEDKEFHSVFIQGKGMNLTNGIEGAENKSLAFGSASSTSGHLMPAYYLDQSGVTPASDFFTGSHDLTIDAVINGSAEVGALNSVTWQTRLAANTTNGTSVFYTTPSFADYLWVAGSGIQEKWDAIPGASSSAGCADVNAVLTDAFLSANTTNPLAKALFAAYSTVGYVGIAPGEYDPIEETGCSLGLIEEKYCHAATPDLGNVGNKTSTGPAQSENVGGPSAPAESAGATPVASPTDSQAAGKDTLPSPTPQPTQSGSPKHFGSLLVGAYTFIVIVCM